MRILAIGTSIFPTCGRWSTCLKPLSSFCLKTLQSQKHFCFLPISKDVPLLLSKINSLPTSSRAWHVKRPVLQSTVTSPPALDTRYRGHRRPRGPGAQVFSSGPCRKEKSLGSALFPKQGSLPSPRPLPRKEAHTRPFRCQFPRIMPHAADSRLNHLLTVFPKAPCLLNLAFLFRTDIP